MVLSSLGQTFGKACQPAFVGLWQRQRQSEAQWSCAHGRKIADRHSQRAITQVRREVVLRKVGAQYQGIGGYYPLFAWLGPQQGRVVTDTEGYRVDIAGCLQGRVLEVATN